MNQKEQFNQALNECLDRPVKGESISRILV